MIKLRSSVSLYLFGPFQLTIDGQPVRDFRSNKVRALLAYLALQPRPVERATLAALFWAEMPEAKARRNLSQTLRFLRLALDTEERRLVADRRVIGLRPDEDLFVDVTQFEQLLEAGQLEPALDLYRGELLSGFSLPDSMPFEEWLLGERLRLERQALSALSELAGRALEDGEWERARHFARRHLALDPYSEPACQQLLRALAGLGNQNGLQAAYQEYRLRLETDLGVEPSAATAELARALDNRPPPTNLSRPLTPLRGRDDLLAAIPPLLEAHTLVTLLGLGGIGKSRLAQEVGTQLRHSYPDGVWFVPLAGVPAGPAAPAAIATTIAASLDLSLPQRPAAGHSKVEQLVRALEGRQSLLILDNWEHLVEAAPAVLLPLLGGTRLHLLATSRVRLGVAGERVLRLEGLAPADAEALFVERARQLVPGFGQQRHQAGIRQICRRVAGMPLGIRLAAGWVEHFSLAEIASSIAALRVEPAQAAGVRPGHQTLVAAFDYSWQLLPAARRRQLAALSVFRGSFGREAADRVAGSSLDDLSGLLRHSLLQRVAAGRYELHPLIQEFAARKLAQAGRPHRPAEQHSRYYLALLQETPTDRLALLRDDLGNVREAWEQALRAGDPSRWAPALDAFAHLLSSVGLVGEAFRLLQAALEQVENSPSLADRDLLLARLLYRQGQLVFDHLGKAPSIEIRRRLLLLTREPALRARALVELGDALADQCRWDEAGACFAEAEQLQEQIADVRTRVYVSRVRIHTLTVQFRGDFQEGIRQMEKALALLETLPGAASDCFQVCVTLCMLGIRWRDYALALRYSRRQLDYASRLENRMFEVRAVHDMALVEQFAGMYPQALAHFEQSLTLAQELRLVEDLGIHQANLCLTLRQAGQPEQALASGRAALASIQAARSVRMEGMLRNRLGHTLLALARWEDADAEYGAALDIWAPLNHPNAAEAQAGRAVAAFHLGRREEAGTLADTALAVTARDGLVGIVEPVLLLLNCATVLEQSGQAERAYKALRIAGDWVEQVSGRISSNEVRQHFLARPDNVKLRALLARLSVFTRKQS